MLAGAAGAVFGSGAFTQTETSRNYSVAVVEDDSAQLTLDTTNNGTDAFRQENGRLVIDLEGLSARANTRYEGAFTVRNENQSGESVFVYAPRPLQGGVDDSTPFSQRPFVNEFLHEAVEVLVSDERGLRRDISLPPAYGSGLDPSGYAHDTEGSSPDEASAGPGGKVRNTGAVELAVGEERSVTVRILTADVAVGQSNNTYRFVAERDVPVPGDWDVLNTGGGSP
jgi:hypothetical protein